MCKRTPRIPHQLRTANSYRFASAPESTPDPAQTGQSQALCPQCRLEGPPTLPKREQATPHSRQSLTSPP